MPIGTDVLAIHAGTVVRVEEQFFDGDNVPGHENYVFVRSTLRSRHSLRATEIELRAAFDNRSRAGNHLGGADNNACRVINTPHSKSFQFEEFCSTWSCACEIHTFVTPSDASFKQSVAAMVEE
jgi:hypothetical protein